ncbi:MAG: transcriptional regulator, TetR family [Frankiales bacterium]|nr:transcriptional regulator, TetR family [Frankiales bacterium]
MLDTLRIRVNLCAVGHTREALLDAARAAAVGAGWQAARMADVAAGAGLSRQTLYAEFGSKDGLAQALAVREAQRFLAGAEAARAGSEQTPATAVAASAEWILRTAADDPLVKAVLTDDGLLPYLTTRSDQLLEVVRARDVAFLLGRWPQLPPADVALAVDVVFRLVVSHLVSPAAPPDLAARDIARVVDRLLPTSGEPA